MVVSQVARRRRRGRPQTHSHDGRAPEAARHEHSAGARRLGGARGGAGLREVARARFEAVDALLDVLRVRVDGRGHDLGEVVRLHHRDLTEAKHQLEP